MRSADSAPLRLTPFEEYMLIDDQLAYPMSCFFMTKLKGQFNVAVFESALHNTLENHPLLTSFVMETNGHFHWHNTGKMPDVVRLPFDEKRPFPASKGINLLCESSLKVTVCNENTDPMKVVLDGQTNIIFEVHHSASDAAGIARFIEDILCDYARQIGFADVQRKPVNPDLLTRRSIFGQKQNGILRTWSKQVWGLVRAWAFLLNRVVPLTPTKPDGNASAPGVDYPAILHRDLTVMETECVLLKAKALGITINDFFLCSAFFSMKHWREQHVNDTRRGNFRIAVPINLRTSADKQMPAANIVSMVFLDRKPTKIFDTPFFYRGIFREMRHIKRCDLGWTFIHGLTLFRRIVGSVRKMTQQNRCWTTATVTNLGRLFCDVPLPRREGRIRMDESLELIGVETSPPVRPWTALGISVSSYADYMTINLHYDSAVLTRSDAQTILERFCNITGGHLPARHVLLPTV